jgi:4-hydroxy-3-polyprenylbenzoate decarboxylase
MELLMHIFSCIDLKKDILFCSGPLDVLDHSSDNFSFGGKAGFDATVKFPEESRDRKNSVHRNNSALSDLLKVLSAISLFKSINLDLFSHNIPVLIVAVNNSEDQNIIDKVKDSLKAADPEGILKLILAVDHSVDPNDLHLVAWQVLGNSDPKRDHDYISPASLFIDGTIKVHRNGNFPRKWPNVVCSNNETIAVIDQKWESLGIGQFISSPSLKYLGLLREGKDEILTGDNEW